MLTLRLGVTLLSLLHSS